MWPSFPVQVILSPIAADEELPQAKPTFTTFTWPCSPFLRVASRSLPGPLARAPCSAASEAFLSQKLRSKGAKLRGERRRGASPRAARAKTFKGLFAPVASSPSVRYALGCARSSAARRLGSGPRGPTGPPRIGDRPSSVLRHPPRSRHSPTRPAVPRNLRAPVAGASAPESSRKPQGKTPNFGRPRGHARLR